MIGSVCPTVRAGSSETCINHESPRLERRGLLDGACGTANTVPKPADPTTEGVADRRTV
jgi:hypothetical protein